MLRLAGEVADGAMLWLCNPEYIRAVVTPELRAGRERAGRTMEDFDVVAAVPQAVVAAVAVEHVGALATPQAVVAGAPAQQVAALAAEHPVAEAAAQQHVVVAAGRSSGSRMATPGSVSGGGATLAPVTSVSTDALWSPGVGSLLVVATLTA